MAERDYIQQPVDVGYEQGISQMGRRGPRVSAKEWFDTIARIMAMGLALRGGFNPPKLVAWRGVRPATPAAPYRTDPGDLGVGTYYTTSKPYAKAYAGKRGELIRARMEPHNPLMLSGEEASTLGRSYRTVEGKTIGERIGGAKALTDDLRRKGYDSIIAKGYEGGPNATTILLFP